MKPGEVSHLSMEILTYHLTANTCGIFSTLGRFGGIVECQARDGMARSHLLIYYSETVSLGDAFYLNHSYERASFRPPPRAGMRASFLSLVSRIRQRGSCHARSGATRVEG